MSVSTFIENAAFSKVIAGIVIPNRDGLVGEFFMGGNEDSSIRNIAGGPPLVAVGTPIYNDGYVYMEGGGYGDNRFDTQISPTSSSDETIIVILKRHLNDYPASCHSSSFSGLFNYNKQTAYYNGQGGSLSNVADVPPPPTGGPDFYMTAGAGEFAQLGEAHSWESGVRTTAIAEVVGGNRPTAPYKFCNSTGRCNYAYFAIFNRKLEVAELDIVYANAKTFLASRGVTLS